MKLIIILYCFLYLSICKEYPVVKLRLFGGCNVETDVNCIAIPGPDTVKFCNSPIGCYNATRDILAQKDNNIDYWIKWEFIEWK